MQSREARARRRAIRSTVAAAVAAAAFLTSPALAGAYRVTVHMHGSGQVVETTDAGLMDCTFGGLTESSTGDCVAGSAEPGYGAGWIVSLQARVPTAYYDRGWRFHKWVDSSAGGQINCDPQPTTGDHTSVNCQFQIFSNLQTNLYFDDTFGPQAIAITSGPQGSTRATSGTFNFNASDDPDALYECRLDPPGSATGSYADCGSSSDKSESYSGLADGAYTFYVRSRDPSGNPGAETSRTWTVDTVAPTVTISGGPAHGSTTESTSATFSVSSTEGATPACTIDGLSTPCNTNKTNLTAGSHVFAAQATDAAGNTGSASRSWTVVAPETAITSGPTGGSITGSSVTFGFSAGPSAECSLDGAAWSACTSPQSYTLPGGTHTFSVRAKNGPNVDQTPASVTWIVDADGDGSIVPQDCKDTDSSTRPGATDTPGDGIDQDCSGADATAQSPTTSGGAALQPTTLGGSTPVGALTSPAPALPAAMPATVSHRLAVTRRGTTFRRLVVQKLPAGSTVTVRCKGSSCPRRSFTRTAGTELLLKPFMRKLLKPATRLTFTIRAPRFTTRTVTYLIRAGRKPKVGVT